ncbi:hypothetical protein C8R43DRAFT_1124960 [Mycena crocata]|nr:hypothetical protein C8R43DRAFT_1124960 [Mycena crocata]
MRVPPALEIVARLDKPAFGMNNSDEFPTTTQMILRRPGCACTGANYTPRPLCGGSSLPPRSNAGRTAPLLRSPVRSGALQIENRIVQMLTRVGLLFQLRGGHVGPAQEKVLILREFWFVVEAHDSTTPVVKSGEARDFTFQTQTLLGPIIASWWLRPTQTEPLRDSDAPAVLGGYHSFAVEEPSVRLLFVTHLMLEHIFYEFDSDWRINKIIRLYAVQGQEVPDVGK